MLEMVKLSSTGGHACTKFWASKVVCFMYVNNLKNLALNITMSTWWIF